MPVSRFKFRTDGAELQYFPAPLQRVARGGKGAATTSAYTFHYVSPGDTREPLKIPNEQLKSMLKAGIIKKIP